MNIVSIDIGLKNLGMVEFWWDEHPRHHPELIKWHKVDLTMLPHKRVQFHACDIPHTNEMADLWLTLCRSTTRSSKRRTPSC